MFLTLHDAYYFLGDFSIPIMVKYGNAPFGSHHAGFSYCDTMKNVTGPSYGIFNCHGATARYVVVQRFYQRRNQALILCHVKVIGRSMSYFLNEALFSLKFKEINYLSFHGLCFNGHYPNLSSIGDYLWIFLLGLLMVMV